MRKYAFTFILMLLCVSLFVACAAPVSQTTPTTAAGKTAETTAAPNESKAEAEGQAADAQAATPAAAEKADDPAASDGETIKIGAMGPLTGAVAMYGVASTNGTKLAIDEINAAGGINGRKIELILEDEKGDAAEAVNVYKKLKSEGIVALIGDVTSGPCEAVAAEAVKDGIPMITPTGTMLSLTAGRANVFRICFTDPFQGTKLAQYAVDTLKAKTYALLRNNSDPYSAGVADAFKAEAEKLGLQSVGEESYGASDTDFHPQLTKIAEADPDVLVLPDYYQVIALIVPQAREVGVKAAFLGPDGWDSVLEQMDKENYGSIEGSFFSNHYSPDDTAQKVQNFVKSYKDTYDMAPSSFAALGYDAARIMAQAIQEAASVDSASIVAAMDAISYDGVTGLTRFDENNNPIKTVSMITIKDGAYVLDSVVGND